MTRDEAKKMAEKWAAKYANGLAGKNYDACYHDCLLSFLACYDAMTSGKPDGYCAWHPVDGWDGLTFDELEREANKLSLGNDCDSPDWQIVPVKLIKVEGSSK